MLTGGFFEARKDSRPLSFNVSARDVYTREFFVTSENINTKLQTLKHKEWWRRKRLAVSRVLWLDGHKGCKGLREREHSHHNSYPTAPGLGKCLARIKNQRSSQMVPHTKSQVGIVYLIERMIRIFSSERGKIHFK